MSEWWNAGPKPTIVYQPDDPFVKDFVHSLGMTAINEAITRACSARQSGGAVPVGTYEAFVNTLLDAGSIRDFSIAEAQLGAFNASFTFSSSTVDVTVTNPISLNSAALHVFSGVGGALSSLGLSSAGQGFAALGQQQGNKRFGNVNQELHIRKVNPCP